MKRLIPAAIIAVGIHSLLMSIGVDWMNLTGFKKPSTGSVSIMLESIQPQTIKPKSEPLPPKKFPQKVEKNGVETAPKAKPPLPPIVQKKRIRVIKKPEKKPPIVKSAPAKQDRPAEPKKPAPPDQTPPPSPESAPHETSIGNDAPLQPPQEETETTAFDTAATGPASNQPALPSVLEAAQPEYSKNPPISYPKRARRRGYEGTVLLEVLVNRNGKVADLRILASSGYSILDRSAVNSVKTWSFIPAKKGDDTVDMWVKVPVRFKLE
ncbi:MAG: energy transducer TonB [Desulfobacterales bacterium]